MLFGVGDVVVAGRYSQEVVSAIGVAGGLFAPFILVGLGLCFAISPLASRFEGEKRDYPHLLSSAYWLSTFVALVLMGVLAVVINSIHHFKLLPEIEPLVVQYLWIVMPSLLGIVHFQVSKEYLQAKGHTFMSNGLILFFNGINVVLNIVLIFGLGPIPELGIQGAALATLIGRSLMALSLYLYIRYEFIYERAPKISEMREIIKLGLPISMSTFFEVMVFSVVTLLIGQMDVVTSAAHNIVLTMAGLTFMVPLGMSSAVSVKVAHAFGRGDREGVKSEAFSALGLSLGFMGLTACLYFTIPEILLLFATDDPILIEAAAALLFFAALFQLPDGAQITLMGILRGLGVTKLPMLLTFVANWVIALPTGYYLAFHQGLQARGLWLGLAIGLTGMSLALAGIFWWELRKSRAYMP